MVNWQKYKSEEQRDGAVARWKLSGLSQAEFCRREGLSASALSDWKKKKSEVGAKKAVALDKRKNRIRKTGVELERYWKNLVEDYAAGGLGMREFCRRNHVGISSLTKWRSYFAKYDKESTKRIAIGPFLQLKAPEKAAPPVAETLLEINLPGGAKIQVTEKTSLSLLAKTLKALETLC